MTPRFIAVLKTGLCHLMEIITPYYRELHPFPKYLYSSVQELRKNELFGQLWGTFRTSARKMTLMVESLSEKMHGGLFFFFYFPCLDIIVPPALLWFMCYSLFSPCCVNKFQNNSVCGLLNGAQKLDMFLKLVSGLSTHHC